MKRLAIVLPVFIFLLFISDCKTYVNVDEPADILFSQNKVSGHLGGYDVYLHKKNGVYRLDNAYVSNDTLYGQPVAVDSTALNGNARDHRYDMNVYAPQGTDTASTGYVAVPKKSIQKVGMTGIDLRKTIVDDGTKGDGDNDGLILGMSVLVFVLLMIVLAILLFWLIIYLIGQAANQTANASNSGSNSGTSNSGSGGSNSGNGGGSGSGGSNSGCYIATMVYGDYDAPEVMVLRKFRDETLSRSSGGRAFIQWYYSWSPRFVERYHHLRWLHRCIRFVLDGFVRLLSR